jgi:hypothetical protein
VRTTFKRSLSNLRTTGTSPDLSRALRDFRMLKCRSSDNILDLTNDYKTDKILGQGRFGIVRLAYQGPDRSKPCVIKLHNKIKLIQANALSTVEVINRSSE